MKKILITMLSLVIVVGGIILLNEASSSSKDLEIKDIEVNTGTEGIRKFDLTYENIINRGSSNVLIGVITGRDLLNNEREVFKVTVQEEILGETNSKEILVYTSNNNLLELGEEYLLLLLKNSSTVYDKDFYVQNGEFVLKVLNDGSLARLIDVNSKKYAPPFTNEKYNSSKELVSYTKANFSMKTINSKAINSFDSNIKLANKADHIIEIKTLNITEAENGLALVEYVITNKYKNGSLDNVHKLLLPQSSVISGEEYLLFLTELEDGAVTPTTRENSIIAKGSSLYPTIINEIVK